MSEHETRVDRILGYGGIALVTIAISLTIAMIQSSELGKVDWMEVLAGILGLAIVAWMVAITLRHIRGHGKRGGRSLLIAGWVSVPVITGLVLVLGGFAGRDESFGEWVGDLLGSPEPYLMLLAVPLLLASVAILIDTVDQGWRGPGKVQGTLGWHEHRTP